MVAFLTKLLLIFSVIANLFSGMPFHKRAATISVLYRCDSCWFNDE